MIQFIHRKEFFMEGSNAILQNPGNLKYTIINVGRNDRKNVTMLQPKYDQNIYGLNFICFL